MSKNNYIMYAIVDVETTGGGCTTGRIIEIAIAVFDGHTIVKSFESLVKPLEPLPPFITKLTGINASMLKQAPSFSTLAPKLIKILQGNIFVAHNVSADYGFVKNEFQRIGYNFNMPRVCTLSESKKVFTGLSSYGLKNISRSLEIHNNAPHRAMGDVLVTVELFHRILQHHQFHTNQLDIKNEKN
jgi:DNA polymerase III subunit epsilon